MAGAVPIYKLVLPGLGPLSGTSPHLVSASLVQDTCAACHVSHTGRAVTLSNTAGIQYSLCYKCHGTGATFDVPADFASKPPNDATTASYYSHPVADGSASLHVLGPSEELEASADELMGRSNRHATCTDCHQPHNASNARPQQSTTGWTASGDIAAAPGVSVFNGAAATAPTYQLVRLRGGAGAMTYEYQLCLRCHSGWTTLPVRSAAAAPGPTPDSIDGGVVEAPAWWALDKGIEMNPANTAYHPVEASGKNISAQMAGSLAGTSPFKTWTFTIDSTVRCTHCHGDPSTVKQAAGDPAKTPAADAYEASHASPNRGILIAPYRDRTLKPTGQAYSANDFGLCYLCHAEAAFTTTGPEDYTSTATAFLLHTKHVSGITTNGNAICSECHFRIHSNALAYQVGDTAPVARSTNYANLVNFAPNVTASGELGTRLWSPPNGSGSGSCALTCHGQDHNPKSYQVAPATGFTATPTTVKVGVNVQFTDMTRYISAGSATWCWTFGDGATLPSCDSTAQNPTHAYATAATYPVSLRVTRTSGNTTPMTMTRTAYITVTP